MFYITEFLLVWVSASEYFSNVASHLSSTYPSRSVQQKLPFVLKHRIKLTSSSLPDLGPENWIHLVMILEWSNLYSCQTKLQDYHMKLFQMSTLITHDNQSFILPNRGNLFHAFLRVKGLFSNWILWFVTFVLNYTSSCLGKLLKIRCSAISSSDIYFWLPLAHVHLWIYLCLHTHIYMKEYILACLLI